LRLVLGGVPLHRAKGASFLTIVAADAALGMETHAAPLTYGEGVGGTHTGARRVVASAAYDDNETLAKATIGAHMDARVR